MTASRPEIYDAPASAIGSNPQVSGVHIVCRPFDEYLGRGRSKPSAYFTIYNHGGQMWMGTNSPTAAIRCASKLMAETHD